MILANTLDFKATIDGFTRYHKSPDGRQRDRLDRLDTFAFYIAGTQLGDHRVYFIEVVGHADADPARGPDFERQISLQRADAARAVLLAQIAKWAKSLGPAAAFEASMIFNMVRGAGAEERLVQHPKTEAERARNRRIEITLLHSFGIAPEAQPSLQPEPGNRQPIPQPPDPTPGIPQWWKLPDPKSGPSSNPFDFKLTNPTIGDWQFKPDFDPLMKTLGWLRDRLKL